MHVNEHQLRLHMHPFGLPLGDFLFPTIHENIGVYNDRNLNQGAEKQYRPDRSRMNAQVSKKNRDIRHICSGTSPEQKSDQQIQQIL